MRELHCMPFMVTMFSQITQAVESFGLERVMANPDVRYADDTIALVAMVAINCFITLEADVESVCGSPQVCSIMYGNVE